MRKLNITAGAGNCPAHDLSTKDNYYFDGVYLDETQKRYPSAVNITSQKELNLFAVCDGEGENGFMSSYYAMEYLDKYNDRLYSEDDPDWDFTLKNYLVNTNRLINIERERAKSETAAKITVLGFDEEHFYGAGVGDCAVFLLRNGELTDLTAGFDKAVSLGKSEKTPEIFSISKTKLRDGDRVLLLNGQAAAYLNKHSIKQLLNRDDDINQNVNDIIKAAVDSGAKGNVTAVLVRADSNRSSSFLARKSGARLIAFIFILLLLTIAAIASLYFALDSGNGSIALPF